MKTTAEIANLFDETKWGKDFTRQEVEIIAKYLSMHSYSKGEEIFRQGDKERYMAFITEGRVDIIKESHDCLEKIVVTLSPRTHFGEMAFIDEEPRSASAIARDDVSMLVLSRESFEHIAATYPAIGIKMLKNIARMISQRLRMTTGKLVYTRE
ncbi:MAG: cyclic nucleotide-binding domain-containing protein [Desulfovibrio sp.]|nr:cyclic nucleotide-binding domain-containing protein [Desulfovibrio sp.]MCA1986612.1 cyclic nucleotide-binding domain-containing protein [Desulfovibrio sp.]